MDGRMMLLARKVVLEDEAEPNGFLRWCCPCGQAYKGNVQDSCFVDLIYMHVEECVAAVRSIAFYPIETKSADGFCVECLEHEGYNGGRCKNMFVDGDGKRIGRCACRSKVHPKGILKGDASLRGR